MRYAVSSHFLSPSRHSSAPAIPHHQEAWHQMPDLFGVERQIKRNRSLTAEQISSGHTPVLRAGAAWTPGHNERTALAFFPTAGVCCPIWPRLLGTAGNTVVAPDPPKTPTSSAQQTPPRDAHTVAKIVLEVIALIFQRVERFIFD